MPASDEADLETTPEQLVAALASQSPPLLVDVREPGEQAAGILDGARLVPLRDLESAELGVMPGRSIVLYCAGGRRSLDGARRLRKLGVRDVKSLRGGYDDWHRRGLPTSPPPEAMAAGFDRARLERYTRQLRLPEVGLEGQRRLAAARVLCIGAGGLGSPACLYLAAAGIGELGIVDDDVVALHNLHRQVIHTTARVGMAKTDSAAETLAALDPGVRLRLRRERLDAANAEALIAGYDIVLDGSDNFATRYLVNDVALRLGRPAVFGAVLRFEGQVSVVDGPPCYRCLFPEPPPPEASPSCAEAGVLGVVPGLVGLLQATEVLKLVLGLGECLRGRLLSIDTLSASFTTLAVQPDPACPSCAARRDG